MTSVHPPSLKFYSAYRNSHNIFGDFITASWKNFLFLLLIMKSYSSLKTQFPLQHLPLSQAVDTLIIVSSPILYHFLGKPVNKQHHKSKIHMRFCDTGHCLNPLPTNHSLTPSSWHLLNSWKLLLYHKRNWSVLWMASYTI